MKKFIVNRQTMCTYSIIVEAQSEEEVMNRLAANEIYLSDCFCEEGSNNSCDSWIEEIPQDQYDDYIYPVLKSDAMLVHKLI